MAKKRVAVFGATGCRTCENTLLDLNYQVSELGRWAEIRFWPYVLGSCWEDLEAEEGLDVCFYAGAVRTEADRKAALKLREKCRVLVSLGACAAYGGLPGLADLAADRYGRPAQRRGTGLDTGEGAPEPEENASPPTDEPEVLALSQVVDVDYEIPGCPPLPSLAWAAFKILVAKPGEQSNLTYAVSRLPEVIARAAEAGVLPPKGSVFAGEKGVCATCSKVKEEKRFERCKRAHEKYDESGRCLLEQGLICQGLATREGCGGLCTAVGVACRGCFGKAEAVYDPGAKMVAAVASTFDSEDLERIEAIVEGIEDLTGTFYRYLYPAQCRIKIRRTRTEHGNADNR